MFQFTHIFNLKIELGIELILNLRLPVALAMDFRDQEKKDCLCITSLEHLTYLLYQENM